MSAQLDEYVEAVAATPLHSEAAEAAEAAGRGEGMEGMPKPVSPRVHPCMRVCVRVCVRVCGCGCGCGCIGVVHARALIRLTRVRRSYSGRGGTSWETCAS